MPKNIMEAVINSLAQPLYIRGNHKGYLLPWSLISPLCRKWSRNRDPDSSRIEEMIKYAAEGGYLPPFIHLAEILS